MAPSGTDNTVTLPQNGTYVVQAADFGFSDSHDTPQNNFLAVKIDTLPSLGLLADNQVPVLSGQVIPVVDIVLGKLKYTPAAGGWGTPYSAFLFQVKDDGGTAAGGVDIDQSPNTLTFNVALVNIPPIAPAADTFAVAAGSTLTGAVLRNDFDPQGEPLFAALATDVSHGTLTLNTDGMFSYAPAAGFAGTDSFTYRATNNQTTSDPATVTINVATPGANSAPAADSDLYYGLQGGSVSPTPGVLANDTDAEHDALAAVLVDNAQHGTVTLNPNGSFQYVPVASYTGLDHFTYRASDGQLAGNVATVWIDLFAIGPPPAINHAPQGTNKTVAIAAGSTYTLSAADWGFSDSADTPANTLMAVEITTLPAAGSLQLGNAAVTAGQVISTSSINAGLLRFVAGADATGAPYASFTFQVQDNSGTANGGADLDPSPNAFTFDAGTLLPVNHPPSGINRTIAMSLNSAYTIQVADFGFTDSGDSPQNNFKAVRVATLPVHGMLTDNQVPIAVGQFVPVVDIVQGLLKFTPAADGAGSPYAAFTFQVQDDGGTANGGVDLDQSPNALTFNVVATNVPPIVPAADVFAVAAGGTVSAEVLRNDYDPQGKPLTAVLAGGPAFGLVTLNTDGSFTYTPTAGFTGEDGFFYQASNGQTTSGPVTVTIKVAAPGANSAPATDSDQYYALENGAINVSPGVLANDTDAEHDTLTAALVDGPQHGTVALHADGSFQYTPAADFSGLDHFTYQASDGQLLGNIATASIAVFAIGSPPVNHAPSGTDETVTIATGSSYTLSASDWGFTDQDDSPQNALLAVKIATLPTAGTLQLGNAAVAVGQVIAISSITAGNLLFVPAAGGSGSPYASLTFQVQDNGGTANGGVDLDQTPNKISFNVVTAQPVNHAPSGSDKTIATLEDSAYTVSLADFGFTDAADTPQNNFAAVRIVALPVAGKLTINGVAVTVGQFVTAADIAVGLLRFVPATNGNGAPYASLAFQVRDDGGTANGGVDLDPSPNTITFNVLPVNDPPTFVKGDDQTATDESGRVTVPSWATHISAGAENETGQLLAFRIVVDKPELFAVLPAVDASGSLTFTPQPNSSGTAVVGIVLQDDGGTANGGIDASQPQLLNITIDKPHALHNSDDPLDVNGDGHVVAGDALDVINFINAGGAVAHASRLSATAATEQVSYYDVNGDGFVTAVDALLVIDQINAYGNGEGESPGGSGATALNDTEMLIALDLIAQRKSNVVGPQ